MSFIITFPMGIHACMFRKGNSTNTGMMESIFCILKSETFYEYEKNINLQKNLRRQPSFILIITTTNEL